MDQDHQLKTQTCLTKTDIQTVAKGKLILIKKQPQWMGSRGNCRTQRRIQDPTESHRKPLQRPGHELQLSFNRSIIWIVDDLKDGKVRDAIKKRLDNRNKWRKIADRSPAGWATVKEYEADDLADDSGDERKIRAAESGALTWFSDSLSTLCCSIFVLGLSRPVSECPPASFQRVYNPRLQKGQNRFSGRCFAYGEPGHWRSTCRIPTQAFSVVSTKLPATTKKLQSHQPAFRRRSAAHRSYRSPRLSKSSLK